MRNTKAGRTDSLNSQPKSDDPTYQHFDIDYGMNKYSIKKPVLQRSSQLRAEILLAAVVEARLTGRFIIGIRSPTNPTKLRLHKNHQNGSRILCDINKTIVADNFERKRNILGVEKTYTGESYDEHSYIQTRTRDDKKTKTIIESKQSKEINDIWYALDYQDRRINKLVEENKDYKEKLKIYEKKLDGEVSGLRDQIQGLKSNIESIVDIVKVFQTHFEQLREKSKKERTQSPRLSSGTTARTCAKKQIILNSRVRKKSKKAKALGNQATLTDTESNKMHDIMKKGYFNSKPKAAYINSKPKSNSISTNKNIQNKLKVLNNKNQSNSRSPKRADSQSTESNRKIKSTIASSDLKRSHELRKSGESVSISSEKPKAAYFKNTLDSHNKIGSIGFKNYSKTKTLITPVQNVKLYSNEAISSNNEIEEQLPQMMKYFDLDKNKKSPINNVIQYQLDLSEGFIENPHIGSTRIQKSTSEHMEFKSRKQ